MDSRQAVFLEDTSGLYDAIFIDNGHLFGGPSWTTEPHAVMLVRNGPAIFSTTHSNAIVTDWVRRLKLLFPHKIHEALRLVPDEWYQGSLTLLEGMMHSRLRNLDCLVQDEVFAMQRLQQRSTRCSASALCLTGLKLEL